MHLLLHSSKFLALLIIPTSYLPSSSLQPELEFIFSYVVNAGLQAHSAGMYPVGRYEIA